MGALRIAPPPKPERSSSMSKFAVAFNLTLLVCAISVPVLILIGSF